MFSTPWKYNKALQGISVIEILVVIAILVIAFAFLLGAAAFSLKFFTLVKETTQANTLAQEVMEATRNFRDGTTWDTDGLGTLSLGAAYHPQKSADTPPKWTLVSGEETINGFTRKVVFTNARRDGSDNIVESGGTEDPETKKVTVTVSWGNQKVEIVTYLTNWKQ